MVDEPIRPSRWWYVLAACVLLVGVGASVTMMQQGREDQLAHLEDFARLQDGSQEKPDREFVGRHLTLMLRSGAAFGLLIASKGIAITILVLVLLKRIAAKRRLADAARAQG